MSRPLAAEGAPVRAPLRRSRGNRWVAGVVGGIAEYFGANALALRVLLLVSLACALPMVLPAYLIAWVMLRPAPDHRDQPWRDALWNRPAAAPTAAIPEPRRAVAGLRQRFADLDARLARAEAAVTAPEFELSRKIRDL
ncbi:MAG TPA: PspC domain-containing protein [Azospirillaceae bacterium]|nr:PspC domain-containing protein [Azospirillaceae bacterium]